MFAEADKALLEDCYLSWGPSLEGRDEGHGVEKDVEISFFVDVSNGVQVDLYRSFLAFWVDLEYLVLGLQDLKDWSFVMFSDYGKQRNERVVIDLMAGIDKVIVHFLEIRFDDCRLVVCLLLASFPGLHFVNNNTKKSRVIPTQIHPYL